MNNLIQMVQLQNIAGVFNKQKNVLGMMPHPERMIDPALIW